MPRIVSIATALMWLLVLLASFAFAGPDGAISLHTPIALIGDAIMAGILGVIVASIYFACRPRLWLALLLLLMSLVMAVPFCYGIWVHFSLFGGAAPVTPRFGRNDQLYFGAAVIFITLPVFWAVICWRRRDVRAET